MGQGQYKCKVIGTIETVEIEHSYNKRNTHTIYISRHNSTVYYVETQYPRRDETAALAPSSRTTDTRVLLVVLCRGSGNTRDDDGAYADDGEGVPGEDDRIIARTRLNTAAVWSPPILPPRVYISPKGRKNFSELVCVNGRGTSGEKHERKFLHVCRKKLKKKKPSQKRQSHAYNTTTSACPFFYL